MRNLHRHLLLIGAALFLWSSLLYVATSDSLLVATIYLAAALSLLMLRSVAPVRS